MAGFYLTIMFNVMMACFNWDALLKEVRNRRDNEKAQQSCLLKKDILKPTEDAYRREYSLS